MVNFEAVSAPIFSMITVKTSIRDGLQYGYDFPRYWKPWWARVFQYIFSEADQDVYGAMTRPGYRNVVVKKHFPSSPERASLPILALKETAVLCHEALPCEL
jgi:hypothetical protein